ncbi:uncharacterized protein MONBRDRAFT_26350 [Monosiga brevicollis MX1]|uniref:Uncharacterized protein n=1 Tax=Monosiga brevicollis TaxID=81824 RepID=A9V241_MONBE|nr:uncharacterized protein MONBRDRAFT_26350 [Monosiga brevicollis MX1]EDQ88315.1 predicted protein [Monosiga brevicollis MX1]|eukprot:XP_001746908.1 hypothetical protein [Monosiga brevicollis MX1]
MATPSSAARAAGTRVTIQHQHLVRMILGYLQNQEPAAYAACVAVGLDAEADPATPASPASASPLQTVRRLALQARYSELHALLKLSLQDHPQQHAAARRALWRQQCRELCWTPATCHLGLAAAYESAQLHRQEQETRLTELVRAIRLQDRTIDEATIRAWCLPLPPDPLNHLARLRLQLAQELQAILQHFLTARAGVSSSRPSSQPNPHNVKDEAQCAAQASADPLVQLLARGLLAQTLPAPEVRFERSRWPEPLPAEDVQTGNIPANAPNAPRPAATSTATAPHHRFAPSAGDRPASKSNRGPRTHGPSQLRPADPPWAPETNTAPNAAPSFAPLTKVPSRLEHAFIGQVEDHQPVRTMAFHPHAPLLAVGSNSALLRICAVPAPGAERSSTATSHPTTLTLLAQRERYHAFELQSHSITPMAAVTLEGTVRSIAFARNQHVLAAVGSGHANVALLNVASATVELQQSTGASQVARIVPWQSSSFLSGSADAILRLHDPRQPIPVEQFSWDSGITALDVLPNTHQCLIGARDGQLGLIDLRMKKAVLTWEPHADEVRSVHVMPSHSALRSSGSTPALALSAAFDGKIQLSALPGHDRFLAGSYGRAAAHSNKAIAVQFHPTEPMFASSSADKTVKLWSLRL